MLNDITMDDTIIFEKNTYEGLQFSLFRKRY